MKKSSKFKGVVVPMVTPVSATGGLDVPALDRLVDSLLAGPVDGIFVMGTTGEGAAIPRTYRMAVVEQTIARVSGRTKVFAGIGDAHPQEMIAGNEYLRAGADAVVSRPPVGISPEKILPWYQNLLDGLQGPLLLYNMPVISKVSIPLEVVEQLMGHPRLAGIKDSENSPARLEELLRRFGGKEDFSVFVGVGLLMEMGLKLGADGIVPSVGNLIPEVCHQFCRAAERSDWVEVGHHFNRMNMVAALYQKGRTLDESLAALKGAMHCRGLCHPHVLPPLIALKEAQLNQLRDEMLHLQLLK